MSILSFFRSVGSVLSKVWKGIKLVIPDEQLLFAIGLVEEAATKLADNPSRREWVVTELIKRFGIPESVARLITELAVRAVKDQIAIGANKVKTDIQTS